ISPFIPAVAIQPFLTLAFIYYHFLSWMQWSAATSTRNLNSGNNLLGSFLPHLGKPCKSLHCMEVESLDFCKKSPSSPAQTLLAPRRTLSWRTFGGSGGNSRTKHHRPASLGEKK